MTTPTSTPRPGTDAFSAAIEDEYLVEGEIARGGMGVVYRARDFRLDRVVAIKALLPLVGADPAKRARFIREARTAARLSHPSIVPIYRADEVGDSAFFVMGFVDGESLAQRVRVLGPRPAGEVSRLIREVALALDYAHAQGVVHRDVKAENILIDSASGRAMITDFGIARVAEATPLTATDQVLGTVHYLSPEQASGDHVDGRSDLYSLGVVAFFACTGRFPFESPLASAVLVAQVTKSPPPLASLAPTTPPAFARVIDRLLVKDPAKRFQTGAELADALMAVERDVGRSSLSVRTADARVSEQDAHAVWQRAAELQAMTGAQRVVLEVKAAKGPAREPVPGSGYRLSDVRDAARESGIPTQVVDRALIEQGLLPATSSDGPEVVRDLVPLQPAERDVLSRPAGPWFTGAPARASYEVTIAGEMPEREYHLIVHLLQRRLGEEGVTSLVGRSLTWQVPRHYPIQMNAKAEPLRASLVTGSGETTVHVTEGYRDLALGRFLGIVVGGGFFGGMVIVGSTVGWRFAGPAAVVWGSWLGATYLVARTTVRAMVRRRRDALRELTKDIADVVRRSLRGN